MFVDQFNITLGSLRALNAVTWFVAITLVTAASVIKVFEDAIGTVDSCTRRPLKEISFQ